MVLNAIWIFFFLASFIVALFKLIFNSDFNVFNAIITDIFGMAEVSVMTIALPLVGVMAFWLGMMRIAESAGLVQKLSRFLSPFFSKIFKGVPEGHPAHSSMLMNFSANMLGLDNAATPLGLKAMGQLQELNPTKERASDAQIMFLVLNTSGLTLIPTTILALRATNGAADPTDIFLPILIATFISSLVGLISVSIIQKINLFQPVVLKYLGSALVILGSLVWGLSQLDQNQLKIVSKVATGLIILGIISVFIIAGWLKKVNVYEQFVDGATEGFTVALKIIPYLIAILCAIAAFKASGCISMIKDGITYVAEFFTSETRFVEGIPTAIMKPLSGSGAKGMMLETWGWNPETKIYTGIDSFAGRLTSVMQGSTETTFYVLAVYFGSVGIKNTRYAVACGLLADLSGIIAAISLSYIFFG